MQAAGVRSRLGSRWPVLLCVALAFAVRCAALVRSGGLRGIVDYDDAVYLSASQHLIAGDLPYRDFLFLHPPAITVLLTPFAALAHLVGDDSALALARLTFAAVGAANAGLVAVLLRRYGPVAALSGGLLYAGWNATTGAETTIMLEPLLNLGLLLTLVLLRRATSMRGTAVVGLVIGVAVAVKIWALADVVALLGLLVLTSGRRRALAWLAGAAVGAAVVIAPFALLVPGRSWRYLVTDQLGRERDSGTLLDRLRYFDGVSGRRYVDAVPAVVIGVAALVIVAGISFVAVAGLARRRRRVDDPAWWAVIALARLAVLWAGPSFYYHYAAFGAAPLCLLAGYGLGRVATAAAAPAVRALVVVVVVALAALTAIGVHHFGVERVDRAPLAAFIRDHRCTWSSDNQILEVAGALTSNIDRGCPGWVDPFGVALDQFADTDTFTTKDAMRADPRYQARLRRQLARSDALILPSGIWGPPFSADTRTWVRANFTQTGTSGDYSLYERTGA